MYNMAWCFMRTTRQHTFHLKQWLPSGMPGSHTVLTRFGTKRLLLVSITERILERMQIFQWWGCRMHRKWLAGTEGRTVVVQRNLHFGEMLGQVHINCMRLCWKLTNYCLHMLLSYLSSCGLYECPLYIVHRWKSSCPNNNFNWSPTTVSFVQVKCQSDSF